LDATGVAVETDEKSEPENMRRKTAHQLLFRHIHTLLENHTIHNLDRLVNWPFKVIQRRIRLGSNL